MTSAYPQTEEQETLPDRILVYLREHAGEFVDIHETLTQRLATELGVVDVITVVEAVHALQKTGLVVLAGNKVLTLTEEGWTSDARPYEPAETFEPVPDEPSDHPSQSEPTSDGRSDERSLDTATGPNQAPSPASAQAPVQVVIHDEVHEHTESELAEALTEVSDREGEGMAPTNERGQAILDYLRQKGGVVRDDEGRASSIVAAGAGLNGTITADLKRLADMRLIVRDIRGRRTFGISLSARGAGVAKKGGPSGARNVRKLSRKRVVGANGRRKVDAAERPTGSRRKRRGAGRRGARARQARPAAKRSGAREVHASPRNLSGPGSVEKELAALRLVTQALSDLTPPQRRRIVAYLTEAFE